MRFMYVRCTCDVRGMHTCDVGYTCDVYSEHVRAVSLGKTQIRI